MYQMSYFVEINFTVCTGFPNQSINVSRLMVVGSFARVVCTHYIRGRRESPRDD